ncbi:MAG: DmsE family decaheme c-type cytochrome [Vicinamibacterales bacterium]
MTRTPGVGRRATGVAMAALGVAMATALAMAAGPAATRARQAPAAAPATAQAGYAGQATCLTCHAEMDYKGSLHGLAARPKTPAATHGCESCHGPGASHAESGDASLIQNPSRMTPQQASEACVSCHTRGTHALWTGSPHDQRNVGCVSCHSVHAAKGPAQIKAPTQKALCATCHKPVVNRQHRFSHMPVREGKLECSSCHNSHGSTNQSLLKTGTTVDESCTSCHQEKRGPYLWEHAPVANACVTCHDAHGSNNDRMLVAKVPFVCQRCHVTSRHPPTVYDGFLLKNSQNANKIVGRGCVVCHSQIHGSNAPSGKSFLR